jgi:hypothetical protein
VNRRVVIPAAACAWSRSRDRQVQPLDDLEEVALELGPRDAKGPAVDEPAQSRDPLPRRLAIQHPPQLLRCHEGPDVGLADGGLERVVVQVARGHVDEGAREAGHGDAMPPDDASVLLPPGHDAGCTYLAPHGDLDRQLLAVGQDSPQCRPAPSHEARAASASQHGGHELSSAREPRASYRVHTAMHGVEPSGGEHVRDRVRGEAEPEQLRPLDRVVLLPSQLLKVLVPRYGHDRKK